ncbi:translocation protein TolB [Pelotomaculum schinkii]|uniref:Translocation protein TolB n=2 Tax=Pelotomaculum schinkii TaxID=78350 RepID=A0A4Y7R975_9FIRM|nr:translocation protein TolB [Pelotomaculum schinkii]
MPATVQLKGLNINRLKKGRIGLSRDRMPPAKILLVVPVLMVIAVLTLYGTAVNDKGEESAGILNVYCESESNPVNRTIGFGDLVFTGYNNDLRLTNDGKKAVFSAYNYPPGIEAGVESSLLLLDLVTEKITTLDRGNTIRALGWDPAGENVLYVKDSNLTRFSLQEGAVNTLAEETYYGSYSPDGSMIAYTRGKSGLWVCDRNGDNQKRLTQATEDWYPVWYPDGQHLFYFNDLGQELGDGAGRLQGMAKISVEDGSIEPLFPEKTGKFRSAGWIVPGESLHVVSGWDDVYYHHIMDLNGRKITDLGENNNEYAQGGYVTAVSGGGRLFKVAKGGLIEIYDGTGALQKSFDLGQAGQVYTSASYASDGRILTMHYLPSPGEAQVEKVIEILDPSTGNSTAVSQGRDNYEACFWGIGGHEVWVLEKNVLDSHYVLTGFSLVPIGDAELFKPLPM